jgi:hypothetical protein
VNQTDGNYRKSRPDLASTELNCQACSGVAKERRW